MSRPTVPPNVQNAALAHLIRLLDGVSEFHTRRDSRNRSVKRQKRAPSTSKVGPSTAPMEEEPPQRPAILQHVSIGINEVTKHLEAMNKQRREPQTLQDNPSPPLRFIFVCRADVDPPLLIDHMPHSVAAYNSTKPPDTLILIPLPKGAASALAGAVGLRRVAVVGVHVSFVTRSDNNSSLNRCRSIPRTSMNCCCSLLLSQYLKRPGLPMPLTRNIRPSCFQLISNRSRQRLLRIQRPERHGKWRSERRLGKNGSFDHQFNYVEI